MYEVNHITNLANASIINKFHKLEMSGKIGPSFTYTPSYPIDSNPEDVLAAEDVGDLVANYRMDVYMWGKYPIAAMGLLEEKGQAPTVEADDAELLESAKPGFPGINYYQMATNTFNPLNGAGAGEMNTAGKKDLSGGIGVPGIYKRVENLFVERTNWDQETDPEGLRIGLRRITSRYYMPVPITENGLGEYGKSTEDKQIHGDYRINYLQGHAKTTKEAILDGAEALDYCA